MQSGSKLVVVLAVLAVALGAVSWWNRYETAHRVTEFWGPENARLIVEPGEVEASLIKFDVRSGETTLEPLAGLSGYSVVSRADLSQAPGMAHLRFALTSDSNYNWEDQQSELVTWKWAFRFSGEGRELVVLFDEDFETLGKLSVDSDEVEIRSCQPMAETLQQYFSSMELPKAPASPASNTLD